MGKVKNTKKVKNAKVAKTTKAAKKIQKASWRQFIKFYRKIKIPWLWLICATVASIAVKKFEVGLVPYTSKIMEGQILEHGFIPTFIFLSFVYESIGYIQEACNDIFGLKLSRNVRFSVWRKIIHLPMSHFRNDDSQGLVSRITQDATGSTGAINAIVLLFTAGYGMYTSFIQMYMRYKSLSLIMLVGVPVAIIVSIFIGKLEYSRNRINNDAISQNTNFFAERMSNIFHIKSNNMSKSESEAGCYENNLRYIAEKKAERRFIFIAPLGTLAQYIFEIVLLFTATAMVRAGAMRQTQMINLYNYFLVFFSNMYMFIAIWQIIKSSHGSLNTLSRIMDDEDEPLNEGEAISDEAKDIKFENVTFTYDGTRNVLDNVSFVIPSGKVTALVGENGCGKSTIIKLIERFADVNDGTIRIGTDKLYNLSLKQWRDQVGYLFQGDQLVKGTIAENIAYGVEGEYSMEDVYKAAKEARAYDFIMSKDQGFETPISSVDNNLSGGEMQRIAVARILMKKPKYLIMDEATSGIDVINEREVVSSINHAMEGRTVIMVSHDMNMIKKADNIIVVANGKIEAQGSLEYVSNNSKQFQEFISAE